LARPNFQFEKRQKELARKNKKEQKKQSRQDKKPITPEEKPTHLRDEEESAV